MTLTVTDGEGLSESTDLTITVTPPNTAPTAVASADVMQGDAPLTVAFVGSASTDDSGIVSYLWNFGDGTTSTDIDVAHVYDTAGSYDVSLAVTDAGGLTDIATLTITVNAVNGAPTAIAVADVLSGIAALDVSFDASGSTDDAGIVSYAWDLGDGNTAEGVQVSHTYDTPGTYVVALTVTDSEGLSDEASLTIVVSSANGAPIAQGSSSVPDETDPLTLSFSASAPLMTLEWYPIFGILVMGIPRKVR